MNKFLLSRLQYTGNWIINKLVVFSRVIYSSSFCVHKWPHLPDKEMLHVALSTSMEYIFEEFILWIVQDCFIIDNQRICHAWDWLWHSVITFLNQSCSIPVRSCIWPLSFFIKISVKYLIVNSIQLDLWKFFFIFSSHVCFFYPSHQACICRFLYLTVILLFLKHQSCISLLWFQSYIWLYWHLYTI